MFLIDSYRIRRLYVSTSLTSHICTTFATITKKRFRVYSSKSNLASANISNTCDSRANSLNSTMQRPAMSSLRFTRLFSQRDKLDRGKDNDVFSSSLERKGHFWSRNLDTKTRSLEKLLFVPRRITARLCSIFDTFSNISSSRSATSSLWYAQIMLVLIMAGNTKKEGVKIKTML